VKKKIFTTYDERNHRACVKLSEVDQSIFSSINQSFIYPLPNNRGKQGWTPIEMRKICKELSTDTLTTAYYEVAPKNLQTALESMSMTKQ
jgi:hypothetical protein